MSPDRPLVIVTGSGGFLGRALIARLVERFTVVGLEAVMPVASPSSFETIFTDLTSDDSVHAAFERVRSGYGASIAAVVHLAAYYDLSGDPSPKYQAVTVEGTRRLLHALQSFEIERLIFASTLLVHASGKRGQKINEDSPLDPRTPYPASKLATEQVLHDERGKVPIAILRLAGVYDENTSAVFLAQQMANIFERTLVSHVYPGDLSAGQPNLHIDDMVDAMLRVIDRRASLPDEVTLLIGETETLGYGDLQQRLGRLIHDEDWETREIPKALAKSGQWVQEDVLDQDPFVQPWMIDQSDTHYELDVSRAEQLIGWRPQHAMSAELPAMVAALKKDPPRWYKTNKLNPAKVAAAGTEWTRESPEDAAKREAKSREVERHLHREHAETLWAPLTNIALGLWLAASPIAFGLFDGPSDATNPPPALGWTLPPPAVRDAWLGYSEIATGALIVVLGLLSLSRKYDWSRWALAAVGTWLMFAPLVFWTTSAAAFTNDSIVGALLVAFAVLIGTPPGISSDALAIETDTPRGWTYSPSSYVQRVPIVVLAFIAFLVSRYMTAFQLGHIDAVWDPAFGDGTETIITSSASKAWPIPDAGIGAVTYLIEALTGIIGDRRRWRTMPWLVLGFGLLIVPLGAVSIFFIIIQPILFDTWCGLCLITAVITVLMIPYAADELVATTQFLLQSRRAGRPFWRTFWRGGQLPGGARDNNPGIDSPIGAVLETFVTGGVTYPWTLAAVTALGVILMCTRLLFGASDAMADSDHLIGCLIITVSVTAFAEIARPLRFLNVPMGAWLIAAPFVLQGASTIGTFASVALGAAVIVLSLPRGKLSGEHYGGWDRYIV